MQWLRLLEYGALVPKIEAGVSTVGSDAGRGVPVHVAAVRAVRLTDEKKEKKKRTGRPRDGALGRHPRLARSESCSSCEAPIQAGEEPLLRPKATGARFGTEPKASVTRHC